MEIGWGWARVRERVTSCRIARLNNCDPPVTNRYKHRTVGGGDGRGKHTYTMCARCWGKISFFLRFHKIYQTTHPAESDRYTLRLTVVRSPRRLHSGETRKAYCATSRFLIKWKAVIDWLSELDTMLFDSIVADKIVKFKIFCSSLRFLFFQLKHDNNFIRW